ncbi:MAG: DUF2156 domain-containing protein [Deltaproteobacteria bacterium]|nr:DUF2156 domain-containing protein [Deltaproteobacteria bacterium]MBW2120247.1 DUF2156 domain-containing protein [Deltaproteobacteria bacterium]
MKGFEIPQPIPASICLACDVCCRFPERESFLAPFFTEEELLGALETGEGGVEFRGVPQSAGGQVVPVPWADGFRCPFFEGETHFCRIYRRRPLDCRLYPYALMLDPSGSGVWLGVDTKCPATGDPEILESLVASGTAIAEASMCPELIGILKRSPRLIGPHQRDVLPLLRLEELTEALLAAGRLIPWESPCHAFPGRFADEEEPVPPVPVESLRPLTISDRAVMEAHLRQRKPRLASHSFAVQFMSRDLVSPLWCELEEFFCLWAFDGGTVYMPLPPLGPGDLRRVLPRCFAFMDQHNERPWISRIENLCFSDVSGGILEEFRIRPGFPDYLYRREDLVELQGRAFRARRSDCRAFARNPGIDYRPYEQEDEVPCQALFDRWQADRMEKTADPVARKMLEDSRSYHFQVLAHGPAMGLTGRVVCMLGDVVAYTFGFPLNEETFVVALEVTEPSLRGASAYVFREFSRELEGYRYIDAMDDSGLPGLRRLKWSYHPCRLEPALVLYRG